MATIAGGLPVGRLTTAAATGSHHQTAAHDYGDPGRTLIGFKREEKVSAAWHGKTRFALLRYVEEEVRDVKWQPIWPRFPKGKCRQNEPIILSGWGASRYRQRPIRSDSPTVDDSTFSLRRNGGGMNQRGQCSAMAAS